MQILSILFFLLIEPEKFQDSEMFLYEADCVKRQQILPTTKIHEIYKALPDPFKKSAICKKSLLPLVLLKFLCRELIGY